MNNFKDSEIFKEELLKLLYSPSLSHDFVHTITSASPKTVENWYRGRAIPGKKNFRKICDLAGIPQEEIDRLEKLRDKADAGKRKRKVPDFSANLKEIFKPYGKITEVVKKTGITRATIHNWITGESLPTETRLGYLINALNLDEGKKAELMEMLKAEKVKNPKVRTRKSAKLENSLANQLIRKLPRTSVVKSKSPSFHFVFEETPVLVRLKITSLDSVFTNACEAMRITGYNRSIVIVESIFTHRLEPLFGHHGISMISKDDFINQHINN